MTAAVDGHGQARLRPETAFRLDHAAAIDGEVGNERRLDFDPEAIHLRAAHIARVDAKPALTLHAHAGILAAAFDDRDALCGPRHHGDDAAALQLNPAELRHGDHLGSESGSGEGDSCDSSGEKAHGKYPLISTLHM